MDTVATRALPARTNPAQAPWFAAVQITALALLALALWWAGVPLEPHRGLLALLLVAFGLISLAWLAAVLLDAYAGSAAAPFVAWVAMLRRGPVMSLLGGLTLATACYLSASRTFAVADTGQFGQFAKGLPIIAPVVMLATLIIAHASILPALRAKQAPFGLAALLGAVLLVLLATAFYALVTLAQPFNGWYVIEFRQYAGLLAGALLYGSALWLGGAGIRPEARWLILPEGMVLVLSWFLMYWR
jgi:hypothetical protein